MDELRTADDVEIRLEGVGRRFGNVVAVDGVNLDVTRGEFVTLLGPSGCGKTTTLRMIAGLEEPDEGRIFIGGRLVSDAATRLFVPPESRSVGMVFQSYAVWPHMTVFENVAFPLRVRRWPREESERRKKVMDALRLVGLAHLAERPATALSGGQQQRVAIARAIVYEPQVLLMDEPHSNLDAKLREEMRNELRALQQRLGMTTVYVTHDQEEAMILSDRVVVMHAGRVLQVGSPEEIYMNPADATVAEFLSFPTSLEATVRSSTPRGNGSVEVEVEGERWRGRCIARNPLQAGARVRAFVRSEDLLVARPGAAPPDRPDMVVWEGTVEQSRFRGHARMLLVRSDAALFRVDVPRGERFEEGESVLLMAEPGRILAFPA